MFTIPFTPASGRGGDRFQSFADPGPLPEELTHVPGFIDELADWTLARSPSPNRLLAFAGALSMLAHLSGRTHTDPHGTHTNLYTVVLGESGIGKDAPRKTNSRLAELVDFQESIAEAFASGEAVEDALLKCPSILLQADEVASFFGKMRGTGTASRSMGERIRRLYTSSGSTYVVRAKAGKEAGAKQILFPHLTLFGTGVPEEFLSALTPHEIRDGLFGRCLILCAEDKLVSQSPDAYVAIPPSVSKAARMFAQWEKASIESGVMVMRCVPESSEAVEAMEQVKEASVALRKALAESEMPMARATVVRMNEKIAKLALLWALSENPENPRITRAAVEWATAFTVHVTRWMLFEGQFHSGEGRFGQLRDRAVAALARNGGSMDRRTLLRALKCDIATFKRLMSTLLVSEIIDEPSYVEGKLTYVLRKE